MSTEKAKPPRGRPKTMNPESVCDTAMCAYWQDDPADVSVNGICDLAGISKPSLYREFGNEDGLRRAALDRYAEQVLTDVFALTSGDDGMATTLAALTDFACDDPRMAHGCLFQKMRSGKHRLGPMTRARVDELNAAALQGFEAFLRRCELAGELPAGISVEGGACYLHEQLGLAITQRATGADSQSVREMLTLALSVFMRS